MVNPLSRTFSLLSILTLIFCWSFLGGAGGCSGGGGAEQDQAPYAGPVRLVSIYPSGGPPGTTVSLCTQGIADEAIFSFCDRPV
ncbi:MAG: hypothetical protein HYY44_04020, partial [Deltaproteobacteria bacterium]|nr:hypothetical protein [Deltaproteobacteria bacterium]